MKKLLASTFIASLLLMIITGIGLAALPHIEVSGTFVTTSTTIHNATQDKFNEVIDLSSTVTYTGTFEAHLFCRAR
jgi:hypothetical protein